MYWVHSVQRTGEMKDMTLGNARIVVLGTLLPIPPCSRSTGATLGSISPGRDKNASVSITAAAHSRLSTANAMVKSL